MSSVESFGALEQYGVTAVQEESEDELSSPTYQMSDYPDPIDHGMGINAVLNDLDADEGSLYRRVWEFWQSDVGSREEEPYVLLEDAHEQLSWTNEDYPAHLVLSSKAWKVGTSAVDGEVRGQRYEYSVRLMRCDPETGELDQSARLPISYQTWIRPQNEALVYKSGDELECPFGEGTKLQAQTTYASASEAVRRTQEIVTLAMDAMDTERPHFTERVNEDSLTVWKGEVHHRFSEELMDVVCETLREASRLIDVGGDATLDTAGKRQEAGRVESLVRSNRWDHLGFAQPDGREIGCKVYRMSNFNHLSDERLRQPKIEAFLAGRDHGTNLPHVNEWTALRGALRQLVNGIAIRSGVALADLRKDDYYDAWERDRVEVPVPAGWRARIREANEERERRILKTTYESFSTSKWDILWTIAVNKGASYDMLEETTGLARPTIREYVAELEEQEILQRLTWPRIMVFWNEQLRVNAIDALQEVHPDRGTPEIKADAERRREERAEQRRERERKAEEQEQLDEREAADAGADDLEDDVDEPATWRPFSEVPITTSQLERALDQEYIEHDDVKIRTDPYPALFPR